MDQWECNLFYRRVQPSEILAMTFHGMRKWNEYHLVLSKEEKAACEGK
jgi:hypothetical protein